MGELAKRGGGATQVASPVDEDIDESRANRLLPTFALLLGTKHDENS
jgi:hypothetical protein